MNEPSRDVPDNKVNLYIPSYKYICILLLFSSDHRKLIGTVIRREDYLVPKAGGKFDVEEYDVHPEKYRSIFAEKVCWVAIFFIRSHVTVYPLGRATRMDSMPLAFPRIWAHYTLSEDFIFRKKSITIGSTLVLDNPKKIFCCFNCNA